MRILGGMCLSAFANVPAEPGDALCRGWELLSGLNTGRGSALPCPALLSSP